MSTPTKLLVAATLALFLAPLSTLQAQDASLQITGERPPEAPQSFQEELPSTGTVDRGLVSGIARGGFNMISPVAPEYFGDGRAYVSTYSRQESVRNSIDGKDETGKPKGLKFFALEW